MTWNCGLAASGSTGWAVPIGMMRTCKLKQRSRACFIVMIILMGSILFASTDLADCMATKGKNGGGGGGGGYKFIWDGTWKEVPGAGLTDAALAAAVFNKVFYLFHKGMNNRIYFNTMDASGSWGSWREVPGAGLTDAAPAAASFNGKLYVFHKGMDTRIYFNTMDGGGSWGRWLPVPPGNGVTDAALAAGICASLYLKEGGVPLPILCLYHKGMNKHIYRNILFNGGTWSGWDDRGMFIPWKGKGTDAALATAGDGNELYVFHKGLDNHIYWNREVNTYEHPEANFGEVGGNGLTDRAPAAGTFKGHDGGEIVIVFHKGMNNRIYYNPYFESSGSTWQEVPGNGLTDSALAAAWYGKLYVFHKGMNNRIYYQTVSEKKWW